MSPNLIFLFLLLFIIITLLFKMEGAYLRKQSRGKHFQSSDQFIIILEYKGLKTLLGGRATLFLAPGKKLPPHTPA